MEHGAWWASDHCGYVESKRRAGRYDYDEAVSIVKGANAYSDNPKEAMIMDDMPYPRVVCDECGLEANRLTCLERYGSVPNKPKFDCSTYHKAKCDVCGEEKMVTESRDYFYPDFNLLKK